MKYDPAKTITEHSRTAGVSWTRASSISAVTRLCICGTSGTNRNCVFLSATPNLANMVCCYCAHCRAGFWRGLFTSTIWKLDGGTRAGVIGSDFG